MKDLNTLVQDLQAAVEGAIEEVVTENTQPPYIIVKKEKIVPVLEYLKKEGFNHLSAVSAVDEPPEKIWVVYHLVAIGEKSTLAVKTVLPRDAAEVDSVGNVYPTALWHEREAYDLMGVKFKGHPDLRRILMPDDWVGHPLRKDYEQIKEYHGIKTD